MESKDGALLPLSSRFPPSAPRTGQVAFTTSGAPTPANFLFSHRSVPFVSDSLVLSVGALLMPGVSRPLPPILWFPRGPGRASLRRVLRVRCPSPSIGNLSTYPSREACRGSGVAHRVIYPRSCHALLNPYDLRAGPGSLSMQMNSLYGSSSPNALWGIVVREAVSISSRYGFLPPP